MNTKVTIGLCVRNGAKIVQTAFNSISIQDFPHHLMKLVIVENNSRDNTLSIALKFASETDIPTFVTSSKGGLGATRQIAVDHAEGEYIVWVDDDLVLRNDYVRNQVEFMERNPDAGAARGSYDDFSTKSAINILDFGTDDPSEPLDHIGTGGAIFRLKALEGVNGFDVNITGAGEDLDISRRIRESGWKLFANSSAKVHHRFPPTTLKALWKSHVRFGYANHLLLHKHKDQKLIVFYFPPFALIGGLKTARKIYRMTNLKKAFVFPLLYSFSMIAESLGFIRAHLDRYGHSRSI